MLNIYLLRDVYTNGFFYNILNIVSVLAILCGVFVIITKNPIVSVLFLIGLFFSIASYLMMLGLNFIGLSYLLVYVGAVSILFLFILMLINVRISELVTDNSNSFILAILIGILIFAPINVKGNQFGNIDVSTLNKQIENESNLLEDVIRSLNDLYIVDRENICYVTSKVWDGALGEVSHITSIGNIIYTNYPIWLILTSVILLLSMVGAIIITIKQ